MAAIIDSLLIQRGRRRKSIRKEKTRKKKNLFLLNKT